MSEDFIRFHPSEIAVVPPRVKLFRIGEYVGAHTGSKTANR
jgi:hypothetical protein